LRNNYSYQKEAGCLPLDRLLRPGGLPGQL